MTKEQSDASHATAKMPEFGVTVKPYAVDFTKTDNGFPTISFIGAGYKSSPSPTSVAESFVLAAARRGAKVLTFSPEHNFPSVRWNPLSVATDDEGREYVVDLLAKMRQCELSVDRRAEYLFVLKGLPAGATLADFERALLLYDVTTARKSLAIE